jgi:hypothetical protein
LAEPRTGGFPSAVSIDGGPAVAEYLRRRNENKTAFC